VRQENGVLNMRWLTKRQCTPALSPRRGSHFDREGEDGRLDSSESDRGFPLPMKQDSDRAAGFPAAPVGVRNRGLT